MDPASNEIEAERIILFLLHEDLGISAHTPTHGELKCRKRAFDVVDHAAMVRRLAVFEDQEKLAALMRGQLRLEPFLVKLNRSAGAGFRQDQRRLAKGIPKGTSEPIAFDPGGKMPGPSGWLKRAA